MRIVEEENRAVRGRRLGAAALCALTCLLGPATGASANVATVIQTIDTSLYSPPSPDPMGITYVDDWDSLLMSDSEVSEMPALFTGANLFEIDPVSGALVSTSSTISFSNEPTGVAWDPASNTFFFSDDNRREVFVVDPGLDGVPGTGDDIVTSFDTIAFGSGDPEGITFDSDQGHLFIADGESNEVFHVRPGPNGLFDGVPPAGDDLVTSFDTAIFGAFDPEGITYDWQNRFLYLSADDGVTLYHLTTSGGLVRTIDYSAAGANKPSGLAFGPSSYNPAIYSLYVADRNVDNNEDPNENDGRIYELWLPPITAGNTPPVVDAGPDRSHTLPGDLSLDGTVSDDGLPGPAVVIQWSHQSGPGTVSFGTPNAEDTTASFSTAGTYVLRLSADDGELSASDDVTVVVTGGQGETSIDVPVAAGSDDAEEEASGNMNISSTDLELGTKDGIGQTVGMRFAGVGISRGSTVLNAYVQFQVDESTTGPTPLTIEGEAVDDALTFTGASSNMARRPRTSAQVLWNPGPWPQVGEAGPDQRSSDVTPILQEIIDRPGWVGGNALALFVKGTTGVRTAESADGVAAPILHVEFIGNPPPIVTITSPPDGTSVFEGLPVSFSGTASDEDDGDLSSQLSWSSDLDGPIGSGASFSSSTLSVGTHLITAAVSDSSGVVGSAQISLTVLGNTAPAVAITSPADGSSYYAGASVPFAGSATDTEEGDLSDDLSWRSDLDGPIGTGASFSLASLSLGTHTITASVHDAGGLEGSDQIAVTILANSAPVVSISSPADGSGFQPGDPVPFAGSATDPEEGDLGAALSWSSDLDGPIGSGASFSHSSLSLGTHTITASVSDAGGLGGSDQIAVTISPNSAPVVTITKPADGSEHLLGAAIEFKGGASDAEQGNLSGQLSWASDRDGVFGSGATFITSALSAGTHEITASVVDEGGLLGADQITITVGGNGSPQVTILRPESGHTILAGEPVRFSGDAVDPEDGNISDDLEWASDLDGPFASGAGPGAVFLSEGSHTITATAVDSEGLWGSERITLEVMPVYPVPTLPRAGLLLLGAGLLGAARGLLPRRSLSRGRGSRESG